jgi:hypothetical protein
MGVRHAPLGAMCAGLVLLAGCRFAADSGGTGYLCPDGECPEGQRCVEGRCLASSSDAAVLDAPPARSDGAPGCDQQFGEASGYQLCIEEAESCRFFVSQTCADVCAAHGATCVATEDAEAAAACTTAADEPCDSAYSQQVCTCRRSADVSCATQFGDAKAYDLCGETVETCRFYTEPLTCQELCTAAGVECLLTQDSDPPAECTPYSDRACTSELGTQICTCRK